MSLRARRARERTRGAASDNHAWATSIATLERRAHVGPAQRAEWDRAARAGQADSRGGAEYRRWLIERAAGSHRSPAAFGMDALVPPR